MRGWKLWTCLFHITLFCLIGERVLAGPPLTTIQDTIYKADGTRFNGVAYIEWKSFQAVDQSTIATQSLTLAIVDGVLRVRLVPTTNASSGAYYSVRYHSDGKVQFTEYWAVPPSSTPVTLSSVRVSNGQIIGNPGSGGPPPASIEIGDIPGLDEELAQRPVRGFSYASNRVMRTGATGALEAVSGNVDDCVRVDGSSAPCGAGGGSFVGPGYEDSETPVGLIDGLNTVFTLTETPSPTGSLHLYRNGMLLKQGIDYTVLANGVTMTSEATPRPGDILTATYRTASPDNPTGTAGGALTGSYPNPGIGVGVISNLNVSGVAGIQENKLALNFPTHSNANDPTAAEKAAMSGTAGSPSAANKFVTGEDARMSDARSPSGHQLLGPAHSDATAAGVVRGDLITGQGTTPRWTRLPLGPANRCLMSNGIDAIWNTCLYTGFGAGAIPFVNSQGSLSENLQQLRWDASNVRLSVGTTVSDATLNVQNATGETGVVIRAGQGQGSGRLTRWQDSGGNDLAWMDSTGRLTTTSLVSSSTTLRAAWNDAGAAADPSARANGDAWFNTTENARKSFEAGQTHTTPQVICSMGGATMTGTQVAVIGSCTIPSGLLRQGDRVEMMVEAERTVSASDWELRLQWGNSTVHTRTQGEADSAVHFRAQATMLANSVMVSAMSFGTSGNVQAGVESLSAGYASGLTVSVTGSASSASGAVALRGLTVVRYPAQINQ